MSDPTVPIQQSRRPGPSVSCVFICHDADGRILLARRGSGARDEPGTWDTGAGGIEFGETFEEAVSREVREEYATDALEIETIGVRNVLRSNPATHWIAVLFAVSVDPSRVMIGEPHKFDRLNWFAPDALPNPLHSQTAAGLEMFQAWKTGDVSSGSPSHERSACFDDVTGFPVGSSFDPGG